MNTSPVPPHYEPEHVRALTTQDIIQRQQPATVATWIASIVLAAAAIVWIALVVTGSHHTSVAPSFGVSSPAAPRSAAPAP